MKLPEVGVCHVPAGGAAALELSLARRSHDAVLTLPLGGLGATAAAFAVFLATTAGTAASVVVLASLAFSTGGTRGTVSSGGTVCTRRTIATLCGK